MTAARRGGAAPVTAGLRVAGPPRRVCAVCPGLRAAVPVTRQPAQGTARLLPDSGLASEARAGWHTPRHQSDSVQPRGQGDGSMALHPRYPDRNPRAGGAVRGRPHLTGDSPHAPGARLYDGAGALDGDPPHHPRSSPTAPGLRSRARRGASTGRAASPHRCTPMRLSPSGAYYTPSISWTVQQNTLVRAYALTNNPPSRTVVPRFDRPTHRFGP
jgi:hypothetical protein